MNGTIQIADTANINYATSTVTVMNALISTSFVPPIIHQSMMNISENLITTMSVNPSSIHVTTSLSNLATTVLSTALRNSNNLTKTIIPSLIMTSLEPTILSTTNSIQQFSSKIDSNKLIPTTPTIPTTPSLLFNFTTTLLLQIYTGITTTINTTNNIPNNTIPNNTILNETFTQTNTTLVPPTSPSPLGANTFYAIFIFNGLLALLGMLGNIFVCMVIIRGRKMYTIANLFLMNLAIADICVLIISYPLWLLQVLMPNHWPFGSALCKIIPSISDAFYGVSLGCMTSISIHRYRMILHAMDSQLTFLQSKIIIIVIWLVSLGSISVPLYPVLRYYEGEKHVNITIGNVTNKQYYKYSKCRSVWPSRTYERVIQIFLTIVWYIIPLLIILFTFLRIKWYLQKQMAYEWLKGSEHTLLVANHIMGIKKALRMLAPVVIVFALLMLPWNVIRLVSVFTDIQTVKNVNIYIMVAGTMLVANSVTNPFIYYIMSKEFRIEFKKQVWLLKKRLRLTADSDMYTIKADRYGRQFVRRHESFVDNDSNGNYKYSYPPPQNVKPHNAETDTNISNSYKYSNGIIINDNDYDELFRSHLGNNEDDYEDLRYSLSLRNGENGLYSIVEERSIDIDYKDFTQEEDFDDEEEKEEEERQEVTSFLSEYPYYDKETTL